MILSLLHDQGKKKKKKKINGPHTHTHTYITGKHVEPMTQTDDPRCSDPHS